MDKKALIKSVSDKAGFSEKDCQIVLDSYLETVTESLSRREDVKLVGFGTFTTHDAKGRMGRNPKTGDPVVIPDKVIPKFKAGKLLKDSILASNS